MRPICLSRLGRGAANVASGPARTSIWPNVSRRLGMGGPRHAGHATPRYPEWPVGFAGRRPAGARAPRSTSPALNGTAAPLHQGALSGLARHGQYTPRKKKVRFWHLWKHDKFCHTRLDYSLSESIAYYRQSEPRLYDAVRSNMTYPRLFRLMPCLAHPQTMATSGSSSCFRVFHSLNKGSNASTRQKVGEGGSGCRARPVANESGDLPNGQCPTSAPGDLGGPR